ncbi:hypothetical protein T07_1876 [Trichinella nelsoni]|uniref:Uncharacterized protein n=1 Tax=Trichinella nelsoni TaxID=6336 RepID=A0A0V0RSA6_9BILA|nr:hypothetical protein T07_1876 [Trichinella nelsoni]
MLHLTHRTFDVFPQLWHLFFWFIIFGQCATWSNLAAILGSGLLTRLLLVSIFAVTDTLPRDFVAYALFTFVKDSATSSVSFVLQPPVHYCHVECPKKILLYDFLLRWSIRYSVRNILAKSTLPMYLLYSFTIAGQDTSTKEIDGHLAAPLRRLLLQVICQSLPALFAQGATVPRTTAGPGHCKRPFLTPTRVARRRDGNLPGREGALFLLCPCLVSTSSWVCHTDKVGAVPSGTPSFTIVKM